jgi:hypothetical protein
VLVFTPTSHPGVALACNDLGLRAHVFTDRRNEHAHEHGQKILRDVLYTDAYKKLSAAEDKSKKRVLDTDLSFFAVSAPKDQAVRFFDVAVNTSSAWRGGINKHPASDMDMATVQLVRAELDTNGVVLHSREDGSRGLVANKHFDDEEVVMGVSLLVYTEVALLRTFLNLGGNAALLDSFLLDIKNIEKDDDETGSIVLVSLKGVPVGAARYLQDARLAGKRSNCYMRVHPEKGPNDGLVVLVARSRNGCGISAESGLYADLGETYCPMTLPTASPVKKFKGVLDQFFKPAEMPMAEEQTQSSDSKDTAIVEKSVVAIIEQPIAPVLVVPASVAIPVAPVHAVAPVLAVAAPLQQNRVAGTMLLISETPEYKVQLNAQNKFLATTGVGVSTNKKMKPYSILHSFVGGKVNQEGCDDANSFSFDFSNDKHTNVFFVQKGAVGFKHMKLSTLIETQKADSIYEHDKFTKGVMPKVITLKNKKAFVPVDKELYASVAEACTHSDKVQLQWVVSMEGSKVMPHGVVLANKKEVIVKYGGGTAL